VNLFGALKSFFLPQSIEVDHGAEAIKRRITEAKAAHRQSRDLEAAFRAYRADQLRGPV